MRLQNLSPDLLNPNPWNTNIVGPDNEKKLEQSIDRLGMFKPIIVRELDDGSLEILGGEHRVEAARRKGMDSIPVLNLGKVDDKRAKEISLVDNGRYGADDAVRLAELLSELGSQDDLASFLPYSDVELEAIFSSSSIDLDELDIPDDDEPALPEPSSSGNVQTHQIMRFKVPVEDAPFVSEAVEYVMKTQGFTNEDSLTNAGDALVFIVKHYRDSIVNKD